MKAIVARHGRVTIPKSLRERLGIRPGTVLEFCAHGGALIATRVQTDAVSRVYGCLGASGDTNRFIRALRGNSKP